MKILVTGASGLVGKLVVELAREKHDVRGLSHAELDVTDRAAVHRALREFSPEGVLHCAAYTDVDGAETAPERAEAVNVRGTAHVAEVTREVGGRLVYVSTDYVFDGEEEEPYVEDHPPHPLSVYGRTKLDGERRATALCPEEHVIVRTGWLYGPGKGFVDWARGRLEREEELPLVDDQRGSPTSARELAGAMLTLLEGGHRGLFHFVNRGSASWLELGTAVASELGVRSAKVRAIHGSELGRPAPRPRNSSLSVARFERATGENVLSWREALSRYLDTSGGSR